MSYEYRWTLCIIFKLYSIFILFIIEKGTFLNMNTNENIHFYLLHKKPQKILNNLLYIDWDCLTLNNKMSVIRQ